MRIGYGWDVHRLVVDRALVLGGVRIPAPMGLLGHSDADVLLHAVTDAVLGALALGDIGRWFPNTDPTYQGISSAALLTQVLVSPEVEGWTLVNLDSTVVAERPKIAPHVPAMRETISRLFGVSPERISIKATTAEGLGFAGRGEGIAAHAVVLLDRGTGHGSARLAAAGSAARPGATPAGRAVAEASPPSPGPVSS
jgi:2-C-methyl-D-erythritol 2,4-cyclodiphosphate synthase